MRFPVNLASQPFRKDRPILFASALVGLLMVGSLALLISLAVADRRRSADTRAVIDRLDQRLRRTASEQARLDTLLRRPDNAEVLERSLFLNALLYRKGISWTRVFEDLEKTLPSNVRLINIRPQVVSENQVYLEMTIAAESPQPVVEALTRLESSEVFGATVMHGFVPPSQSDRFYRYRVSVNYAQKL
jgi:type IV pilus assembly protein PilN